MFRDAACSLLTFTCFGCGTACLSSAVIVAAEPTTTSTINARLTTEELANWIDERFSAAWQESKIVPTGVVDEATFLRRTHLDLTGAIPNVSEARDYLEQTSLNRRGLLVDRLLNDGRRPEKYSERTAAHWATVWRRMMVPGNTPEALSAIGLEPWLKKQFATNVP